MRQASFGETEKRKKDYMCSAYSPFLQLRKLLDFKVESLWLSPYLLYPFFYRRSLTLAVCLYGFGLRSAIFSENLPCRNARFARGTPGPLLARHLLAKPKKGKRIICVLHIVLFYSFVSCLILRLKAFGFLLFIISFFLSSLSHSRRMFIRLRIEIGDFLRKPALSQRSLRSRRAIAFARAGIL